MLALGADVKDGALSAALERTSVCDSRVIDLLLAAGASVSEPPELAAQLVELVNSEHAASLPHNVWLALVEAGVPCSSSDAVKTAVHSCSIAGDRAVAVVQSLIDRGVSFARVSRGRRPIHDAVINFNEALLAKLIGVCDFEAFDDSGATPLHYAATYCNRRAAEMLLDAGAEIDKTTTYGSTALLMAASQGRDLFGHAKCIRLLLERGANPNVVNFFGDSVVAHAGRVGAFDSVQLLLDYGADPRVRNSNGENALEYVERWGFAEHVISVLRKHMARSLLLDVAIGLSAKCLPVLLVQEIAECLDEKSIEALSPPTTWAILAAVKNKATVYI